MSNSPHYKGGGVKREEERGRRRVHPLLFVIVLLLGVAGVLWFVSTHSSGAGAQVEPATHPMPAESPGR